jgi:hypothetical protein
MWLDESPKLLENAGPLDAVILPGQDGVIRRSIPIDQIPTGRRFPAWLHLLEASALGRACEARRLPRNVDDSEL